MKLILFAASLLTKYLLYKSYLLEMAGPYIHDNPDTKNVNIVSNNKIKNEAKIECLALI